MALKMLKFIVLSLLSATLIFTKHIPSSSGVSTLDGSIHANVMARAKPTPAKIINADLAQVFHYVRTLEDDANNFPEENPSPMKGIAFQEDFNAVNKALMKTSKDIKAAGSISEDDSRAILSRAEGAEPAIDSAMQVFIDKKDALKSYPVGVGVATTDQDLIRLSESTMNVYDEFILTSPDSMAGEAVLMKKHIYQVFKRAIDIYSS